MTSYYKKNGKKGYTLAEVLTTVMILLILMAIAVPAIFSIRRNLRQKALDNKAELIYTAVQNNLVKLQNNGNKSEYSESQATKLPVQPLDESEQKDLYYVTAIDKDNTSNAAYILVTTDTIDTDLYNNYWVVEYDPQSASVYAVFYSENKKYDYAAEPEHYNSLRYKEERLNDGAWVGYYGGDTVDGGNTSTLAPEITIKNEEKLVASISCMRPDSKPLSFEVTMQDTQGKKLVLRYSPDAAGTGFRHEADDLHLSASSSLDSGYESGTIVGKKYSLDITLDDLTWSKDEKGNQVQPWRFKNLYSTGAMLLKDSGKQLTPGTPLTITVKVISESPKINGRTATVKTNSLFEDSSTETQAVITYGRHLQNLDELSSGVTAVTSAVIKSDIHFEKQEDKEGTESWYSCYGKNMTFVPITNSKLTSLQGKYASSNGTVFSTIYHLTVEEQAKAGLFATLPAGITVDTLWMSGTRIKRASSAADGSVMTDSSAGAIAGTAKGAAKLINCRVFLDASDVEGKDESEKWIAGAAVQGGLIGQTSSEGTVEITQSFAATVMGDENASNVGGLVGNATGNIKITNSYADSYLYGKNVGGLIGECSGSSTTILSSYTVGYLHGTDNVGGFIGRAAGLTTSQFEINNGYTAAWLGNATRKWAVSPSALGENVYFLNAGDHYEGTTSQGTKISYEELSNRSEMRKKLKSDAFTDSAESSNPYNLKKQGLTSYSYPSLTGIPHYGDWEANFESGSLVYYEVYKDGSYGFFGANVSTTLADDKDNKTIVGDGYGIVYLEEKKPDSPFEIRNQNGVDEEGDPIMEIITIDPTSTETTTYTVEAQDDNGVTSTYVIYPLPALVVNEKAITETFYQKMIVSGAVAEGAAIDTGNTRAATDSTDNTDDSATGTVFYYNPHFAKAVVTDDVAPATPGEIYIRTARQLYDLSQYYTDYRQTTLKSKFVQELNINYKAYDWNYANRENSVSVQSPVGKNDSSKSFAAFYDGRYHEIRGISFETDGTAVGFIGVNAGTVQNVFLVWDYDMAASAENPYVRYTGDIENNKTVYMGALAGINSGRIRNCAVCGYELDGNQKVYVQRNGTLYLGGFVGSNKGTIANCEADNPGVNANVLYGNAYLGGFAGENAGTIRESYALGKVMVEYAKGANAVISGFTARNTGALRSDYCAVALTAAGTTKSYGFSPKGGKIDGNCYYLNGGTFQYDQNTYAFDNLNGAGSSLTYKEMSKMSAQSITTRCHSATSTAEDAEYPFVAVVAKNSAGESVHYGNWQNPVNLGAIGVLYWELEQGGSNDGYHFSYIGFKEASEDTNSTLNQISGSTLCTQHDDGGIVTQYGYGYYYLESDTATEEPVWDSNSCENFQTGEKNKDASDALTERLDGFKVVAYTTAPAVDTTAQSTGNLMKMTAQDRTANGEWSFSYKGNKYTFTINPFFANAMQYGTENENAVASQSLTILDDGVDVTDFQSYPMPGTEGKEYEIRSDDQLEYMNWNYSTGDAVTTLDGSNYNKSGIVEAYTYLGYMYHGLEKAETYYKWTEDDSPDVQQYESSQTDGNYVTSRKTNESYWEFVESSSGKMYKVPEWKDASYYYWGWYVSRWQVTYTTKTGYWKWVGVDATPKDRNGNNLDSSYYTKVDPETRYQWRQTHDVDADMIPVSQGGDKLFTQIGSLYDETCTSDDENAQPVIYMSYFNGAYDGNSYSIKNVEIASQSMVIGLFGNIVGAKVQNIILYSDKENYIQRIADSPKSWYALGGLAGIAAVGKGNSPEDTMITNCTVSGYVIQDNSEKSARGDADVGGMFGMSTINLKGCSAVNKIEINTKFAGNKYDGVSVRIGGLVGSMRGKITNCYTGGEIYCTERCLEDASVQGTVSWMPGGWGSKGSKIFMGGITGGVYIKNGGDLLKLLGNSIQGVDDNRCQSDDCSVAATTIKNCYTYIKMPNPTKGGAGYVDNAEYIKSVQPIGSNGETPFESSNNYHVKIEIQNCYYYGDNIPQTKNFTRNAAGAIGKDCTNIDDTAVSIDWEQLAGTKEITNLYTGKTGSLLELLTGAGGNFSTVTVKENNQTVTGKYSFPGNRTDLEGEDYPFPTVLTQQSGGASVNVHYGEWPLEGISWKESRATMDIFEDMDLENDATRGQALKTFVLQDSTTKVLNENTPFESFQFTYGSGSKDTDTATFSDENTQEVFSDGTDDSYDDSFSDGSEGTASMTAADTDGESDDGIQLLDESELIAKVINMQYDSNSGNYIATVKALKTGTTVITATVTGKENQVYTASFTVTVTADLTVYTKPTAVKQVVDSSTEVTLYAVPTALTTSTNQVSFVGNSEDAATFSSGEDAAEEDSVELDAYTDETETFTADDNTYVDMISDNDNETAVYASDLENPSKNFVSMMNWSIESDVPGALEWTEVDTNGVFSVTSYAIGSSTLTITGTYTYENIEYTSTTWLDINTIKDSGIHWRETPERAVKLQPQATGPKAETVIFYLDDDNNYLTYNEDKDQLKITCETDAGATTDTSKIAKIDKIESTEKGYAVTVTCKNSGKVIIKASVVGKDGTSYTAELELTIEIDGLSGTQTADGTDPVDSDLTDSGFASDMTSDADSGFADDDQQNDYVDIIPNEDSADFSDDDGSWESGDSGF